MKIEEEYVYNGIVNIGDDTSMFNKATLMWLYWNGTMNRWEWGSGHNPINKEETKLDRTIIYYFIYDGVLNSIWFVCAYSIKANLWLKPYSLDVFRHFTKNYIHGNSRTICPGETLYFFVYDTKAPYIRKVIYPKETVGEKTWRVLSWINPFKK